MMIPLMDVQGDLGVDTVDSFCLSFSAGRQSVDDRNSFGPLLGM